MPGFEIETQPYDLSSTPESAYKNNPNDVVDFDAVSLAIDYAKENNAELFLTSTQHLTVKNLVGDNGYFRVTIKFLRRASFSADESHSAQYSVLRTETYTLDEWVPMSYNLQLNENGDEWIPSAQSTTVAGISMEFDNGSVAGSNEGEKTVTFRLVCKVLNGYQSVSASFNVKVVPDYYEDTYGEEITLRPVTVLSSVKIMLEEGVYTTLSKDDCFLLVDSSVQSSQIGNTILLINNTARRKLDKKTGQYHYFLGDIEVFGFIRGFLDGYTEGATIPQNGEVVLFNDYEPANSGESNIEVTFPCYVEGNADRINKCRIAKLFGNSNAKNRLFVAGNPDFPNCDWHSSARNNYLENGNEMDSNGDFTYFGDMDYCFYGQTDNAIMGYDNVATDKMVVIKSKSKVEPTNYFRTSSLIQAIDASGNALTGVDGSALYKESFPLATGNVGAGAMNHKSVVNLNGDTLYLSSENTICGLDIAGQVGDSQRISYSRSKYIDPELKELNLSDAFLWSDNYYAYLFAADGAYLTHYETFNSETNQYEWFKIDIKKVRCAIEIDGVTYFGNEYGSFYRFEKDVYDDVQKIDVSVGGTLYGDDKITYNSAINSKISVNDILTFKIKSSSLEETLFRKVASLSNVAGSSVDLLIDQANNVLKLVALNSHGSAELSRYEELKEELAYGGFFYFDKPDGQSQIISTGETSIATYSPYKILPVDDEPDTYLVEIGDTGDRADLTTLAGANICRPLDGEYEIANLDKTDCVFKILQNNRTINVILYSEQDMGNLSFPSEIRKHSYVKAKFITAPATLGSINHRKTIWFWTMTASDKPNDLEVCQATNEERFEEMKRMAFASNIPIGLDFKQLTFMSLDFGKSAIPRKYTYSRPLSVPFFSFGFKSDKPANSTLTAASIVYTTPMLGWGNR